MFNNRSQLIRYSAIFTAVALLTFGLNGSTQISMVVALVSVSLFYMSDQRSAIKSSAEINNVLPEIIDSLISGIQSGMSLVESLISLGDRGPIVTRHFFIDFKERTHSGESFERAVEELQAGFKNRTADQFFESLLLAKTLGGSNLLYLLRQLGDFTRQDLAFRSEVESKQGWVRNSAHVAAIAPWLLLVMLSLQPSTAQAYSDPSGFMVIACGALVTIVAYLWMERLARLPEANRIFGVKR